MSHQPTLADEVFSVREIARVAGAPAETVRQLIAQRGNSALAERMRVDSLARQLGELQQRYDQVSRMLGSTPGTATAVPFTDQAPALPAPAAQTAP